MPAIFPAYITGAVAAAGGCGTLASSSKSSIGETRPRRRPASAPIARTTAEGDSARIALGIGILWLNALASNWLLWRRL
jgi:NitT/TauT family transport system permease protein